MANKKAILTPQDVETFHRQGFLKIPNFYDIPNDVEPVLRDIYAIIGLIINKEGLPIHQQPFSIETFDDGILPLAIENRKLVGLVYDAVKQSSNFMRLLACKRHELIFQELRENALPGICAGGYGIRIDLPFEEKYQAPWHQDYPNQLRSMDGLVFWAPLRNISKALGPVQFCVGSHTQGPHQVRLSDPDNPDKTGPYAMRIAQEKQLLSQASQEAPLSQLGDLMLIDFLTVHASSLNQSDCARWSMQMRYFNFNEPHGQKLNWRGSFAANEDLRHLLPHLVLHE
jgi:Phytanoyl-CoA dioxygenase (PhyH)